MKKIVLTGGGTGGHVIPLLSLVPSLRKVYDEIHFFGRREGIERDLCKNEEVVYHGIDCAKFIRGKIFANLKLPFALYKSVKEAKTLIEEIKPCVIFSKGGFASLPASLGKGKVPLVIHESDRSYGLANRLVKGRADMVLSAFPLKGARLVGSPIRQSVYSGNRERARVEFGFTRPLPTLLITGGSMGAEAINKVVDEGREELTKRFNIIHLCGKGNGNTTEEGYARREFLTNMEDALALCDYALSRGGANTLFELVALAIPSLVVPLPKGASRGDQIENANYFASRSAIEILPQSELTVANLMIRLQNLRTRAVVLKKNMRDFPHLDGRDEICKILSSYAK